MDVLRCAARSLVLLLASLPGCGEDGGSPKPDDAGIEDAGPDGAAADAAVDAGKPPEPEPALGATFEDPLLLTFAAARSRSEYLVDEGYTLARFADGALGFETDTAGNLMVAFVVDGQLLVTEAEWSHAAVIRTTTSDAAVLDMELVSGLTVELRFAVLTSHVALIEAVVDNQSGSSRNVALLSFLRRCREPYTEPTAVEDGLRAHHHDEVDPLLDIVAPHAYVEDLSDVLLGEGGTVTTVGLAGCGADAATDAASLEATAGVPAGSAEVLGLTITSDVPQGRSVLRALRGVVAQMDEAGLVDEVHAAAALGFEQILADGAARIWPRPSHSSLSREDQLAVRSCYVLLDQLMMPAEGAVEHDYFLFSREPTWWFGHVWEHIHEGMALILLAHLEPEEAMEALRVFFDRIEDDGYLPYGIGPMAEQTFGRTASAPLLSFVASEVWAVTGDRAFLEEAYEAGSLAHGFWTSQRDSDGDGLSEWGGLSGIEAIRDLENVIWPGITAADTLEAIDLNSMLVVEEKSLARMADALDRADEAQVWRDEAAARGERINDTMWEDDSGFYFHVFRDTNTFDGPKGENLRRLEIAGFLPIWAGIVPKERLPRLLEKLTDPDLFWRTGGVAGLAADDPYYSPDASRCCRWNGPIWIQWQYMLMRGLQGIGQDGIAREIAVRSLADVRAQLSSVHQFRELYDPDDPAAPNHSMPNYIWSAMAALLALESSR